VLWSPNTAPATVRSVSLLVDILGATLVWIALWNGVSLKWVAGSAGLAAATQGSVALYQFWTGPVERAGGLGGNPNVLAIQLSLTAFLLLLAWGRDRPMGTLAFALILIATITSGSRKVIFVWVIYLLLLSRWLTLGLKRSTVKASIALLVLPASVLLAIETRDTWLAPIENLTVYGRIERAIAGEDNSANVRSDMIRDAVQQWTRSPLWGYGIDQFRWLNSYHEYSHNNYTELLANLGLVGLVLFYAIHANLVWRAASQARNGSGRSWLVLVFVLLLLLMDIARVSYTDRLTWLLLAMVGYICEQETAAETATLAGGADAADPG
jgi:O-antigen ligase